MGRLGARGATGWWLLFALFVFAQGSCRGESTTVAPAPDGGEPSSGGASSGGRPSAGGNAGVDQPAGRGGTRGGTGTTGGRGGDAGSSDGGRAGNPSGGSADDGGAGDGGAGDGGAGYGGDGGAAGSGAGGTTTPGVCENPIASSPNLEFCTGRFVHRPTAGACSLPVRDSELTLPSNAGQEDLEACEDDYPDGCILESNQCTRDADCGSDGYCIRDEYDNYDFSHRILHDCIVPCRTDADCPSDRLCACDSVQQNASRYTVSLGRCVLATCRTDSDCGPESLCISPRNPIPIWHTGTTLSAFHCQTPGDQCHGPSLCPNDSDSDCCPEPACHHSGERFVCGTQDTCDPC